MITHSNDRHTCHAEMDRRINDLFAQQWLRRKSCDSRLPLPPIESFVHEVSAAMNDPNRSVMVVGENETLSCVAIPDLVVYSDDSDMLTYWPIRKGIADVLSIRSDIPANLDHNVEELLKQLDCYWAGRGSTGSVILWPSLDFDVRCLLESAGYLLDGYLAYRSNRDRTTAARDHFPDRLVVRRATALDENDLVDIYLQVISAHIPNSHFAKHVPQEEPRFRERLEEMWMGRGPEQGAPLVVVVELDGKVLAMAESWISCIGTDLRALLPSGRYGYVNSFGVRREARRRGLGRVLEVGVSDYFESERLDGSYLWYNANNRAAEAFWLRVGYRPLWTCYQKRPNTMQA